MNSFKVGDEVQVRQGQIQDGLEYDKTYVIESIETNYATDNLLKVKGDDVQYFVRRFKLIKQKEIKTMYTFKVGDSVELKLNAPLYDYISKGKHYRVRDVNEYYKEITLIDNDGDSNDYLALNFKLACNKPKFVAGNTVKLKVSTKACWNVTHNNTYNVERVTNEGKLVLYNNVGCTRAYNPNNFELYKVTINHSKQQKSHSVEGIKHGIKITVEKNGEKYTIEI